MVGCDTNASLRSTLLHRLCLSLRGGVHGILVHVYHFILKNIFFFDTLFWLYSERLCCQIKTT